MADTYTREGAHRIKLQIEEYWADKGYSVEVRVIRSGFHNILREDGYHIRSDMKNGLPSGASQPNSPTERKAP